LWQQAVACFESGTAQIDSNLCDRENDHRRGLTVIARPGANVRARFDEMLRRLKKVAPEQHFYRSEEFHITVLSLFTATPDFAPHLARLSDYVSAVGSVLRGAERFACDFRGVTATRDAVMVQGFPQSLNLNRLRENLREALRRANLGAGLDQRYRIKAAHSTVMRFQRQPRDLPRLVETLSLYRDHDFGQTAFDALFLVKNDWYMSSDRVEVLAEYPLV
jgi:2'-5' RNA ligase